MFTTALLAMAGALPPAAELPAASVTQPDDLGQIAYDWKMHYTGRVTPVPQRVLGPWQSVPLARDGLCVAVSWSSHPAVRLARALLLQRVRRLTEQANTSTGKQVTVHLGQLESEYVRGVAQRMGLRLDDIVLRPQGYVIRRVGDTVLAAGVDHRGAFYAAMTLLQSIGVVDDKLVLRCADLDDWPHWERRYHATYALPRESGLLSLAMQKFSGFAIQDRGEWRHFHPAGKPHWAGKFRDWQHVSSVHKPFLDRYELLDYQLLLHIYAASPRRLPVLDITNEKDIAQLIEACAYAAKMGFGHIMICADDWTPAEAGRYVCFHASERKRFGDSVGRAHGYLMRRLHEALKRKFPRLDLAFCPAPYSLHVHEVPTRPSRQRYLRDLAHELPDDVYVVWTGPEIRSTNVQRRDFLDFASYVNHQRLYLWDNSSGPAPIARWQTTFYDGFAADSQGIVYLNEDVFGKARKRPFAITANDYLWNPKAYDVKASFRDAVAKLYGPDAPAPAERFVAAYDALAEAKGDREKTLQLLDELDAALGQMRELHMPTHIIARSLEARRARAEVVVPSVRVRRFAVPPKLDGRLDDACWAGAEKLEFRPYSGGTERIDATIGRLGYDAKHLYVAFRAEHRGTLSEPVGMDAHDRSLWGASDDILEIFLRGEKPIYGHWAFDHAGNRFDEERGAGLGLAWNPAWRLAIHRDENAWTAEVAIPFASLAPVIEAPVKPGTVWRGNFCRQLRPAGQWSCWSPTKGNSFHTTEFFGKLLFE